MVSHIFACFEVLLREPETICLLLIFDAFLPWQIIREKKSEKQIMFLQCCFLRVIFSHHISRFLTSEGNLSLSKKRNVFFATLF